MIGSCSLEDVAVRVMTRVIGHCPHRNQLLIDCGWTGLRYLHQYSLPCLNLQTGPDYYLSKCRWHEAQVVLGVGVFYCIFISAIESCPTDLKLVLAFSLDGAGKLPTGYAVIEGHPDLK